MGGGPPAPDARPAAACRAIKNKARAVCVSPPTGMGADGTVSVGNGGGGGRGGRPQHPLLVLVY